MAITHVKLWKQLFQRVGKNQPNLQALLLYKKNTQGDQIESDDLLFKKLFSGPEHVSKNWNCGKFETRKLHIGEFGGTDVISMDTRRIVLCSESALSPTDTVRLAVFNRWKLELECMLVVPQNAGDVRDAKLYGELLFTSHFNNNICVWDLITRKVVVLEEELPNNGLEHEGTRQSLHVAHNLLICVCSNFVGAVIENSPSIVTVRRISSSPIEMVLEKSENISNATFCESDDNYFALYLLCPKDVLIIQLRSIDNFQIIRELDLGKIRFKRNIFGNGLLLFVRSNKDKDKKTITFLDTKTFSRIQNWTIPQFGSKYRYNVALISRHIVSVDFNLVQVFPIPILTDGDSEEERIIDAVFLVDAVCC